MKSDILVHRLHHTDLNVYQCGHHDCEPGHAYGPAVRDHYLIHYIYSGCGKFYFDGKTYSLHAGDGFLIVPDKITYYQADAKDPWSYSWIGFNGLKAESYLSSANLSAENPIFTYTADGFLRNCLDEIIALENMQKGREVRRLGLLYLFLSQLIEANAKNQFSDDDNMRIDQYVQRVAEFIAMNFSRKISIANISSYVGLERSYLGSMFSKTVGMTIQEYLINFRIDKACEMMENPMLSIGDISRSVGYDDQLQFSKIFKKYRGVSPKNYREALS